MTTLNTYLPTSSDPLTHEDFVQAVQAEFQSCYRKKGDLSTQMVNEDNGMNDKVKKGLEELMSEDWTLNQTPEFQNEVEGELSAGKIVSIPL